MTFLGIFFTAVAFYLLCCGWDNTRYIQKLPPVDPHRNRWPFVSVCIPARNEEQRIRPCIETLLVQDYPRYEVLVLDDQSTDGTAPLLRGYARRNRKLKLLHGKPLPAEWVGKPWACHQISMKAKGDWVFFTDADTWHSPDMLKKSVQAAEAGKADLLACLTRQETGTWMEKWVIPVMVYCLIAFMPVRLILEPGSWFSRFAGGGGQFLFFRRGAYEAIGGHLSVKNEIVEDLAIGNRIVSQGLKLSILDGTDVTYCRMYTSAREVWEGFSKNFFPLFRFSAFLALAGYFFLLAVNVLPFLLLFSAKPWTFLFDSASLLCGVELLLRLNQAIRYRMPVLSCFLQPLGSFMFVLIGFNSIRWYLFLKRGVWKGRVLPSA